MMRCGLATILIATCTLPAMAQEQQTWYRPIDQTVEDWNSFSTTFRVTDPGNAQFSDRVSLYQPLNPFQLDPYGNPGSQSFVYQTPGVRAWAQNPEYLSLISHDPVYPEYKFNVAPVKDGAYVNITSAGMVFDLTMPAHPPTEMDLNPALDTRIDARITGQRIDAIPIYEQPMPKPIVGYGNAMIIEESIAAPPRQVRQREVKPAEQAELESETAPE